MEVKEAEFIDGLRGEVTVNRVKRHYFERNYGYGYSVTPESADVARRGGTWMAIYFWRRGLFAVQYEGMKSAEVAKSLSARVEGYEGGTPTGTRISKDEAIRRWVAGERAYFRGSFGGKVRPIQSGK